MQIRTWRQSCFRAPGILASPQCGGCGGVCYVIASHHRRTLSMFQSWNQAVNPKLFCRCLPDELTSGGPE
ncbi:hypothetical protein TNCV_534511 [Trichonephila clavipes]|nr:hypothetical protein TNCV_534511 [Trichonephila clavipes]